MEFAADLISLESGDGVAQGASNRDFALVRRKDDFVTATKADWQIVCEEALLQEKNTSSNFKGADGIGAAEATAAGVDEEAVTAGGDSHDAIQSEQGFAVRLKCLPEREFAGFSIALVNHQGA